MVFYDQPGHGRSGRLRDRRVRAAGARRDAARGARRDRARRPDRPGRPLDGRHDHHGVRRAGYPELFAERVVGRGADRHVGRAGSTRRKFGLPALIGRVGGPLLPLVNSATRLTGPAIDRAREAASDLAWLLTRRYGFGSHRPSPALVSYVEQMNSRTSVDTVARYLRTLYTHARYPALAALRAHAGAGHRRRQGHDHAGGPLGGDPPAPAGRRVRQGPDSGHVVMLEHADEVNAALIAFLEQGLRMTVAVHCGGHPGVRPPAGRPAARRRPGRADRPAGRRQDRAGPGHRRRPGRAGRRHLADVRHRPGAPAGPGARRPGAAGARRRVPAGRRGRPARRDRRPRPGRVDGGLGDRGRVGRGHGRAARRRPPAGAHRPARRRHPGGGAGARRRRLGRRRGSERAREPARPAAGRHGATRWRRTWTPAATADAGRVRHRRVRRRPGLPAAGRPVHRVPALPARGLPGA